MRYNFIVFPLCVSTVWAELLQAGNGQTLELSTPLNLTDLDLTVPFNTSTPNLNALDIQCDGSKYGFNPNLADCDGARSYIAPDSEQQVFGERHTGLPDNVFPLPYAIVGGKQSIL